MFTLATSTENSWPEVLNAQSRINFISRAATNDSGHATTWKKPVDYLCVVMNHFWLKNVTVYAIEKNHSLFVVVVVYLIKDQTLTLLQGHSRPITNSSCIQKLDCGIMEIKDRKTVGCCCCCWSPNNKWTAASFSLSPDLLNKYFKACPAVCPSEYQWV